MPEKRTSGLLMGLPGYPNKDITYPIQKYSRDWIIPDRHYPGMYRVRWRDGKLSGLVNLTRARGALNELKESALPQESKTKKD